MTPKVYTGVCNNCGKKSDYMQRDHRVPRSLGGSNTQYNLQDLCLECHLKKNKLEISLLSFNVSSEEVREWFQLAFQNDKSRITHFLDCLYLTMSHFKEIFYKQFSEKWDDQHKEQTKGELSLADILGYQGNEGNE